MARVVAAEEAAGSVSACEQAFDGIVVHVENTAVLVDAQAAHGGEDVRIRGESEQTAAGERRGHLHVAAEVFIFAGRAERHVAIELGL